MFKYCQEAINLTNYKISSCLKIPWHIIIMLIQQPFGNIVV